MGHGQLPFGVHPAWRAEFAHRWARARPLLWLGFVATPTLVVMASAALLAVLTARGVSPVAAALAGAVFVLPPWIYLLVFRYTRLAAVTDHWGLRIGLCGLLMSCGAGTFSAELPGAWWFLAPGALLAIAVLGGLLAARARGILFEPGDGALAATTLPVSAPIWISTGLFNYIGRATLDGERLSWRIRSGRRYFAGRYTDSVALHEITGVFVFEVTDPASLPPVAVVGNPFTPNGVPVPPPPGPIVVVHTRDRGLAVPVHGPHRFAELIRQRARIRYRPAAPY